MNCGIYSITNLKNGKVYIGASTRLTRRWYEHTLSLVRNDHYSKDMQHDFNDQSKNIDDFEFKVIVYCEEVELCRYERELISKLNPAYNTMPGQLSKEEVDKRKTEEYQAKKLRKEQRLNRRWAHYWDYNLDSPEEKELKQILPPVYVKGRSAFSED